MDGDALARLVDTVTAGAGQPLERSETLPPEAYWSPEFYRLEAERIFRKEWLCVGHVAQIPKEGDYFTLDLMDEMLVVVRGADGIRTLSRVCLHRWAPLVNGTGNARLFSCPFHKWAYGLDGRLLGAPLMERVEFDPKACRLPEFRTEVADGFIYVNFSGDAPPLAAQIGDLSAALAKFAPAGWVIGTTLDYDCKINWKIVVETFMECYHHIAAHPETFERPFPARLTYVDDGHPGWTVGHAPARPDLPDEAITLGFPALGDLTAEERHEFRLYLVYPWHLLNLLPDRAYWFCLQPDGPARTRFQTHVLVRPEALAQPGFAERIAEERRFFEIVNDEDIRVNEMQQLGAATGTARLGRLSHLEKAIWQLADYVRARIAS